MPYETEKVKYDSRKERIMGGYRLFGCIGLSFVLISLLPFSVEQSRGALKKDESVLKVGDKAPLFNANDHLGNLWQAEKVLDSGQYLVVYFYPAAMTGGCTKQACVYRDASAPLKQKGIHVVGISADPVKNLRYFQTEHGLNFPLLSDVNGFIAKRFGVPMRDGGSITRTVEGKEVTLERSYTFARWTFIMDPSGRVVYKNTGVKAAEDSKTVIDFLNTKK
jgi:peroxiredoxin Q/BCP